VVESVQGVVAKEAAEGKAKENQIRRMQDEMAQQDEQVARLGKERKRLEESVAAVNEQLRGEEDKVSWERWGQCFF